MTNKEKKLRKFIMDHTDLDEDDDYEGYDEEDEDDDDPPETFWGPIGFDFNK